MTLYTPITTSTKPTPANTPSSTKVKRGSEYKPCFKYSVNVPASFSAILRSTAQISRFTALSMSDVSFGSPDQNAAPVIASHGVWHENFRHGRLLNPLVLYIGYYADDLERRVLR